MKEKIKAITNTSTFRSTSLVTFATLINGFLGFLFYWLLARFWKFNPEYLGVFTVAATTSSLIIDLSTIGTDTGVVNFVGRYLFTDLDRAKRILKLALVVKVVVSLVVVIVGWFLAPWASVNLFGKSILVLPLRIALVGVASGLLFNFATSALQAIQKFIAWGILNVFSNAARLVFVYIIFLAGLLTVNSALIVYIPITFVCFLVSLLFLPKFLRVKNIWSVASEFFNYNKWVAIFTFISAISSRLDVFLVTKLLTLKDVGVYSVAVTLSGVIPQLVGAVGTVIAPKLSAVQTKENAIRYIKKLQLFVTALSVAGILLGTIVGYIFIKRFYAPVYFDSFYAFIILLVAQAVFLFSVPIHMTVIYYFSYPKLFVIISMVNIFIVGVLGWILIASFGYIGVATAILIGNVTNFIIPAVWVYRKFKE